MEVKITASRRRPCGVQVGVWMGSPRTTSLGFVLLGIAFDVDTPDQLLKMVRIAVVSISSIARPAGLG